MVIVGIVVFGCLCVWCLCCSLCCSCCVVVVSVSRLAVVAGVEFVVGLGMLR